MKLPANSRASLILPAALSCLALASCSTAVRSQGRSYTDPDAAMGPGVTAPTAEESFADVFTLATPMYLYFVEHEEWPTSIKQLQDVAQEFSIPFDLSSYSRLEMRELKDGRLRVHFQMASPGREEGEFTLTKPDTGNSQELEISNSRTLI